MARLLPGENAKIDHINELVRLVQFGNEDESNESIATLLDLFHPMILGLCNKWSKYFNDPNHTLKSFNDLMGDCTYWFFHYTKYKYIIDGPATYNKFIKDHMDQRIRYIYETEINYKSKLLFPDPYSDGDSGDTLDNVINKYSTQTGDSGPEYGMVAECVTDAKSQLVKRIFTLMDCDTFNDRERRIFVEVICNGVTHEALSEQYGISRTRVTQILAKTKKKLYAKIEADGMIWQLLDDADIDITNPKLTGE